MLNADLKSLKETQIVAAADFLNALSCSTHTQQRVTDFTKIESLRTACFKVLRQTRSDKSLEDTDTVKFTHLLDACLLVVSSVFAGNAIADLGQALNEIDQYEPLLSSKGVLYKCASTFYAAKANILLNLLHRKVSRVDEAF